MSAFFIPGERKIRPGVFLRYDDVGVPPIAGPNDGVCAALIHVSPLPAGSEVELPGFNQPVVLERFSDIARTFGPSYSDTGVPFLGVRLLEELFRGGARKVIAVRVSGTASTAYESGMAILEAVPDWSVVAIDSSAVAPQNAMQAALNRMYSDGRFVMGVAGTNTSNFAARLQRARSFNDYQMVYVGNGFRDAANQPVVEVLAAARVAGMIAGTPSNRAITRLRVTGAVEPVEMLTNAQLKEAIQAGMLCFSMAENRTVQVDSGINTLTSPNAQQDVGWMKIKRVRVRFELFGRLRASVSPLIGQVNNDPDGRANVLQVANAVCDAMVAEGKLLQGARVELDPDNPPAGDSAWFRVYADDVDALEKMYFAFNFRFTDDN